MEAAGELMEAAGTIVVGLCIVAGVMLVMALAIPWLEYFGRPIGRLIDKYYDWCDRIQR